MPPIAIVGMGGLFSGSPTLEAFWANIYDGVDTARPIPHDRCRIDPAKLVDDAGVGPDRVFTTNACLIDGPIPAPPGLDPAEYWLKDLDPVIQLALWAGCQAWNMGKTDQVDRSRVGVILGNIVLPTDSATQLTRATLGRVFEEKLLGQRHNTAEVDPLAPRVAALPAAVLASYLRLRGGSFTLDAACASSLYAVKLAIDSLRAGRTDAVLAGGISRPDCLYTQMGFTQLRALSRTGRASPFDARADGLIVGEGAGVFLLKRLEDALSQGDDILGVCAGIGLSNDREGKLLAPSNEGQLRAMRAAYAQAGWRPGEVDLIECHAPGTPVGDAVEFASLETLWSAEPRRPQPCVLGSVKANVGHCLTAAGAAGLLKVLLAIKNRTLPPATNFANPAKEIALKESSFTFLTKAQSWEIQRPLKAAVSAFGFGGINGHLLIEEWPRDQRRSRFVASGFNKPDSGPIAVIALASHTCRQFSKACKRNDWGLQQSSAFAPLFESCPVEGHFLEELTAPLERYRIPPKEIEELLPQQILMLHAVSQVVDQITVNPEVWAKTGTFIGLELDLNTTNFSFRWETSQNLRDAAGPPLSANRVMGALGSIIASRIARSFHIGGPSFTLANEENSGIRALQIAMALLQKGEIDLAIVGAVDLPGDIRSLAARFAGNRNSSSGPWYQDSPAPPLADAACALVLKRLKEAQADGDDILAVIDDVQQITNDESSSGMVPNRDWKITIEDLESTPEIIDAGAAAGLLFLVDVLENGHNSPALLKIPPAPIHFTSASRDGNVLKVFLRSPDKSECQHRRNRDQVRENSNAPRPETKPVAVGGHPFTIPSELPSPIEAREPFENLQSTLAIQSESQALGVKVLASREATANAHESYLRFANKLTEIAGRQLVSEPDNLNEVVSSEVADIVTSPKPSVFLDRTMCLEFARGKIANVLGDVYQEVDTFPTRVRLPDEPLMLVDRIVSIEGEALSLTQGGLVTEHDVKENAWYLDHARMPPSLAIEAGQADLFLAGYLGIDFRTRGQAVYRLLDAVVTFHRHLPRPGEVIRHAIRIERFFRQGETHLFRFSFDATIDGVPLLTMREGCAGFFTPEELAAGKGIVQTALARQTLPGKRPGDWQELVPLGLESFDTGQLDKLRRGDLAGCFGEAFSGLDLDDPAALPGGKLKLVDEVTRVDPRGGRYGMGLIRAHADIHPDDWFLVCHFCDDQVMPGTLMYECCLHTLRIYLMRLGWVGDTGAFGWEPVPGVASRLRCRGQVVGDTGRVTYEVVIKELGYRPAPYAIGDAFISLGDKLIVEITDLSLQMTGMTRENLENLWHKARRASSPRSQIVLFSRERLLEFATGRPSKAFGDPYRPFDSGRFIARLPGPPFQFLRRVTRIDAEPWKMVAGGGIETEYDISEQDWYFDANRSQDMPYAVLLEIALQSCGFQAAYMGSALTSENDLHFRNLGGWAIQHRPVTCDSGTLTTQVKAVTISRSAGMIIQNYNFSVECRECLVLKGHTYFGFFAREALANQIGIRDVQPFEPRRPVASFAKVEYPTHAPFPDKRLRMVDVIDCLDLKGGDAGLGFIRGTKTVDPTEWFFAAHFHQDPVWPGSLGLESFLQLLKVFAWNRWGRVRTFQTPVMGTKHSWIYRGQVVPSSREVSLEATITQINDRDRELVAKGYLSVDDRIIYQMSDFSLKARLEGR